MKNKKKTLQIRKKSQNYVLTRKIGTSFWVPRSPNKVRAQPNFLTLCRPCFYGSGFTEQQAYWGGRRPAPLASVFFSPIRGADECTGRPGSPGPLVIPTLVGSFYTEKKLMGGGRSAAVAAAAWQPQRGNFISRGGEVVTREKTYGTDTLGDGLSSTRPRRRTNKQTNRWTRPWRKASAFTTDGDLGPIAPTILIFKQRLTPALRIAVNLYLRLSMVGAIRPPLIIKQNRVADSLMSTNTQHFIPILSGVSSYCC